jgi:hypothetical protein
MQHGTKAFILIFVAGLGVHAIAFVGRTLPVINLPHFWWILPAMCVLLILGMLGLFISAMLS